MSDIDLDAIEREIGMLLDGPHVYSRVVPEMLAGHARALIAKVREQEQEIVRLRRIIDRDAMFRTLIRNSLNAYDSATADATHER